MSYLEILSDIFVTYSDNMYLWGEKKRISGNY